jgi:glutathione peroxidase
MDLTQISIPGIDDSQIPMSNFLGSPLLLINVASECRFTYQYESIRLNDILYRHRGLITMLFPCNDFSNQEPKPIEEIIRFMQTTFRINLPVFNKIHCIGPNIHPLFQFLTINSCPVKWNFEKFLISPSGELIKRFDSSQQLSDPSVQLFINQFL